MKLKIILLIILLLVIIVLAGYGTRIKQSLIGQITNSIPEYDCGNNSICTTCVINGETCACSENMCDCGNNVTVSKDSCLLQPQKEAVA